MGSVVEITSSRSCFIASDGTKTVYFVGTSAGLYCTDTPSGATTVWSRVGAADIGFAIVSSMRYRPSDQHVVVGTHGNGAYMLDLTNIFIDKCNTPLSINCDTSDNGTTIGESNAFSTYNGLISSFTGPEVIYEFTTTGGPVEINLDILDVSQNLELILMDACSPNTATLLGQSTSTTPTENISLTLPAGTYYIFVDGFSGNASAYELTVKCGPIEVSPKLFLQGPLSGSTMSNLLGSSALLPTTEPYGIDGKTASAATLVNVTDWVIVQIRDKTTNTTVLEEQTALLNPNGNVVDVDGVSPLTFNLVRDNYYVAVKHRNHLSVMTATAIPLN